MNHIVINKDSKDKDASVIANFYLALNGVVLWPVTMQGKTVEEVEGKRTRGLPQGKRRGKMREIKFRAWDKNKKMMAYDIQKEYDTVVGVRYWKDGKITEDEPGEDSFGHYLEQPNIYEVMQFIGLLDKNGKEIYEGDIVDCHLYHDERNRTIYTVVIKDIRALPSKLGGSELVYREVIGNIYEQNTFWRASDLISSLFAEIVTAKNGNTSTRTRS